jgi:hypothetical protein
MNLKGWEQINEDQDLIKLLTAMRSVAHKHDEVKGGTMNMVDQDVRPNAHSFQKDHESFDDEITNTLKERTHSCISLGTSGNIQGSIKCLDLETGRVVKRRTVKVLPMPECVIKRVIKMGKKSRQSRSAHTFEFLNRHKEKYDWDNEELEIEEGLVEEDSYPDLLEEISGVRLESDYESDDVVEVPQITELEIAAQAARNANLAEPREGSDKFTGVSEFTPTNPYRRRRRRRRGQRCITGFARERRRRDIRWRECCERGTGPSPSTQGARP